MTRPHVIVVGAGAYGWGIALRLQELGARATVIDPRGIDAAERASGGITRLLRLEYGARGDYSELTLRARARWREIEALTGLDLYREVGMLYLIPDTDDGVWETASLAATRALGHAGEVIEPGEVARRWPAIDPGGIGWAIANPTGGFLLANRATGALAAMAQDAGARRVAARVVEAHADRVVTDDGRTHVSDLVVLATGAWTRELAGGVAIRPTRQVTCHLRGGPTGIPGFAEGAPFAMYGVPAHDGLGLKVASHATGPERDPDDAAERIATPADVAAIAEFAARRFRLTGDDVQVERAEVCFYAMTPDEDPVIDRLPDGRYVCAGFSGHGFKFAPVLAAAVAEWIMDREPAVALRGFRIAR